MGKVDERHRGRRSLCWALGALHGCRSNLEEANRDEGHLLGHGQITFLARTHMIEQMVEHHVDYGREARPPRGIVLGDEQREGQPEQLSSPERGAANFSEFAPCPRSALRTAAEVQIHLALKEGPSSRRKKVTSTETKTIYFAH